MSEYTTFLKVGAAAVHAADARGPERRAARHDAGEPDPSDPRDQPRHDVPALVRLANGREVSALDIQREYLDRALRYAETRGLPPLEQRALEMWEHCITTIENDPLKLDREVDWVIKYKLLEASGPPRPDVRPPAGPVARPAVPRRLPPAQPLLQAAGPRLRRAHLHRRRHRTAIDTPPQTTRAKLGEFVAPGQGAPRDYTVDWVHLKLNDQAQRTVLCKDPFKSRDERVEKLIDSL